MSGLNFKELGAAVEEAAAGGRSASVPTEGRDYGEARAGLPASLEKDEKTGEYKLPEGYETVGLGPQEERLIPLDEKTGTALIYIENIGFRFSRGRGGEIYIRPEGVRLPDEISPIGGEKRYVELPQVPELGIPLAEGSDLEKVMIRNNFGGGKALGVFGGYKCVYIAIPKEINYKVRMPLLGYAEGIDISVQGDNIAIENSNSRSYMGIQSLDSEPIPEFIKISAPAAALGETGVRGQVGAGAEAAGISVEQRMAGAIRGLADLGKNREVPNLGRRAGKALAELLTAMVEAGPGLTTKMAGAALRKENPTDEDMLMFFGRVAGMAIKMKAEIAEPAPDPEKSLPASLRLLLNLSSAEDSFQRQEAAGAALRQFLTDLSRVDAETRDRLAAAGLNKNPKELTEEDMLIFFGYLVGTAVAMKAKM